ncbi:MAG: hypothetical protein IPM91_04555, partial [Bacteroidetes bacterium]|nr:hypothetical protein [Bacteroidota bacterium]
AIHALHHTNNSQQCFTAVFDGFEKDESAFANTVARQYDLKQHLVRFTANDLLNDWDKLCAHQEEPFGSSSIYAQYKVYEKAREEGVTVLLDGQGADEILAGYQSYYKWYWQELFRKENCTAAKNCAYARERGIHETLITAI